MRYSGDIAKAIAAGASSVMMGRHVRRRTEEAPGEVILFQGRSYKSYRGMGSIGAMQQGSADRYFQESSTGNPNADKLVPEGIEGRVPYKGSMLSIVYQMAGGVRASMGYCGCATIDEMRARAEFMQISNAGMRESHVHDVQITKEAPNYRARLSAGAEGLLCGSPRQAHEAGPTGIAAETPRNSAKTAVSRNQKKESQSWA